MIMRTETIVLRDGQLVTGRLVDHVGEGRVEIERDRRRYVGVKVSTAERRNRR